MDDAPVFTSAAVGDLVSWSVDGEGHVFPAGAEAADTAASHSVFDRNGTEWLVQELETPQAWARGVRCLILNSRECVRRVWHYPDNWRTLDAEALFALSPPKRAG